MPVPVSRPPCFPPYQPVMQYKYRSFPTFRIYPVDHAQSNDLDFTQASPIRPLFVLMSCFAPPTIAGTHAYHLHPSTSRITSVRNTSVGGG